MAWILTASAAFGVGGAFMKTSEGFARLVPGLVALVCFLVGAVLLTMAVRAEGLSSAYTIGLGVEAVVSVGLGRYLYGEHLHAPQALGVGLIVVGVLAIRAG